MKESKESYKILGIDPGTNVLGYAIIEIGPRRSMRLITMGTLKLKHLDDHTTKLKEIFLQLQEIIETYLPKILSIEAPFFGKNVQSMLKLGRAQGVAMAAGITMGLEIHEYSPKKIKQSVTGNGNASKEQVAAMLESIMRIRIDTKTLDSTDALAVAYTYFNQTSGIKTSGKYASWGDFVKKNEDKIK